MKGFGLRALVAALLALPLGACSSNNDSVYSQYWQVVRQAVRGARGDVRISRSEAAAVAYASMGYSVDGGNQSMLVLATDTAGDLLWTSGAHIVIVTRNGRIVRTVGLGHDLAGMTTRDGSAIPSPAAAIQAPFTSTRLEDFPDSGQYGVTLSCRAHVLGRATIRILGQTIPTMHVSETCQSSSPNWIFTDNYWVDPDNGLVWRAQQHVQPRGGVIETEILRPPG